MTMIKTAVSMPRTMFDEVNDAARELEVSRSGLIAMALRAFLRQRESDTMLELLNAAWEDGLDPEEEELLRWAKYHALRRAALEEAEA